jgi:hypothetical protein
MLGKNGHRWTNEEIADLMRAWARGDESAAIAARFEITQRGLHKMITRLRAAGVPLLPRKAGHRAGQHNRPWRQADVEYVIRRRREHATAEQIASELDRTYSGVNGLIQRARNGEGVPVPMLGSGKRRLWDPTLLMALDAADKQAKG